MVAYYDLELFMSELATLMKVQIPIYAAALNTEKDDNLLSTNSIDDCYDTWSLADILPFSVSFLQHVAGDPTIRVLPQGRGAALSYPIRISCFLQDTGDENMPIIKARYNRVLLFIAMNELVTSFPSVQPETIDIDSMLIQTENGATYEIAALTFHVDFAY